MYTTFGHLSQAMTSHQISLVLMNTVPLVPSPVSAMQIQVVIYVQPGITGEETNQVTMSMYKSYVSMKHTKISCVSK